MGPAGATVRMISLLPPYAPTGRPPPMILPSVVRSGVMPKCSCAQPLAMRKPVITSSKHSSAPSSRVMSRRPCAGQPTNLGPIDACRSGVRQRGMIQAIARYLMSALIVSIHKHTLTSSMTRDATAVCRSKTAIAAPLHYLAGQSYLQELLRGHDEAGVADDRLQDDARDLTLVLLENLPHALQVVVGRRQRRRCVTEVPVVSLNAHAAFLHQHAATTQTTAEMGLAMMLQCRDAEQ